MRKPKTPFEQYFYKVKYDPAYGNDIDEVELFDALAKTKFRGRDAWLFKAIVSGEPDPKDSYDNGMMAERFLDVQNLIGFAFDKCSCFGYKIYGIHYDRDDRHLTLFMSKSRR